MYTYTSLTVIQNLNPKHVPYYTNAKYYYIQLLPFNIVKPVTFLMNCAYYMQM